MNILITLCARGGSKGIPKKNTKNICGKPLICYSIELANTLILKWKAKVALSNDDNEIKKIAHDGGLFTNYVRPEFLATDSAGKIDTIKDLLLYEEGLINKKYDYILDLDITSPLRTINDVEEALSSLVQNQEALNLFDYRVFRMRQDRLFKTDYSKRESIKLNKKAKKDVKSLKEILNH